MPAMAPGLRAGLCVTAAASPVVDAGALEVEAVGLPVDDSLEEEGLEPAAPGGSASSGQFWSFGQQATNFKPVVGEDIPRLAAT